MNDDEVSLASNEREVAGWHTDKDSETGIIAKIEMGRIVRTQSVVVESLPVKI
jgi:hypothetical protein